MALQGLGCVFCMAVVTDGQAVPLQSVRNDFSGAQFHHRQKAEEQLRHFLETSCSMSTEASGVLLTEPSTTPTSSSPHVPCS